MKKLILFVSMLLFFSGANAQSCLPEGIEFTSQSQIDNFITNYPGCTEIEGSVTISGDSITNLNGLSVLTSIGGVLAILNNHALSSLVGLINITSIEGYLDVAYNDALTSLTGLENVTFIGNFLNISFNDALTSLTGLEGLTSVESDLVINENIDLINLLGLENLNYIGGQLRIYNNQALESLAGLDNIDANSITDIYINNNISLSTCEVQSICDYLTSPNGKVNIYNNAIGCNNPAEVAIKCGIILPCLPYGNYYFCSQAEIDNFHNNYPECTDLEGYVTIRGSDITNLIGLSSLTSIGGGLVIMGNFTLTSLLGLNNVGYIGESLSISINASLTSLTGLDNVSSVGSDLDILGNNNLTSLAGLENLTFLAGGLSVVHNDSIFSLSGLDNIAAASITNLYIGYNTLLSECEVKSICDYLASPNGTIEIQDNAIGCNSQEEVEEACLNGLEEEEVSENQLIIYPNPGKGIVDFRFSIFDFRWVTAKIFDMQGREVATIMDKRMPAGEHVVPFNVSYLQEGVYFVRMSDEKTVRAVKLLVE